MDTLSDWVHYHKMCSHPLHASQSNDARRSWQRCMHVCHNIHKSTTIHVMQPRQHLLKSMIILDILEVELIVHATRIALWWSSSFSKYIYMQSAVKILLISMNSIFFYPSTPSFINTNWMYEITRTQFRVKNAKK